MLKPLTLLLPPPPPLHPTKARRPRHATNHLDHFLISFSFERTTNKKTANSAEILTLAAVYDEKWAV
ncbi:MAG: hypothetical protein ACT4NV_01550 [Rhodoferax sp.]